VFRGQQSSMAHSSASIRAPRSVTVGLPVSIRTCRISDGRASRGWIGGYLSERVRLVTPYRPDRRSLHERQQASGPKLSSRSVHNGFLMPGDGRAARRSPSRPRPTDGRRLRDREPPRNVDQTVRVCGIAQICKLSADAFVRAAAGITEESAVRRQSIPASPGYGGATREPVVRNRRTPKVGF
jgi:hypothetical protein